MPSLNTHPLLCAAALLTLITPALAGSPRLPFECSWIGNSGPGAKIWVPQDIDHLVVAPDGRLFSNVHWDEGGGNVTVFLNGQVLGNAGHTHGWGYTGGYAVAVNPNYLFLSQRMHSEGGNLVDPDTWPSRGTEWVGVSRRTLKDIRQPAPFPTGKGGKGGTLKGAFLVVDERPVEPGALNRRQANIAGLWATQSRLYVSCPYDSTIKVFDTETMQRIAIWKVERADCLAMDGTGTLWVLQPPQPQANPRVIALDEHGRPLPRAFDLPADSRPRGICIDPQGRLLIADAGPRQQILIYGELSTRPRLVQTFGEPGGVLDSGGVTGRLRFNDPAALACDQHGNIYVAHGASSGGGSTLLESYRPDGHMNWQLAGLEFVDLADVDPAAERDVFTKEERFSLSYDHQPAGKQWKYVAYTIDRRRYPEDPRLHIWSAGAWIRRLAGKRFQFVTDMNANVLQVYRFPEDGSSEIAIPSGLFATRHLQTDDGWPADQPDRGAWIWRDRNGNGAFDTGEYETSGGADTPRYQGWWVDATGNVWLATESDGIRLFPFQGLDPQGNPQWTFSSQRTFPHDPEFKQIKRLRYDPETDTMYLGGTTNEHTNQHWKPMGPVIARYDNWLRGNPRKAWSVVLPYAQGSRGHSSCEPMGFDIAGDYLFVPYSGADRNLGYSTGHVEVLHKTNGQALGHMEPTPDVGETGLQDFRESCRSVRRNNGEYLIFLEDDFKAKVLMYRWKPQ